MRERIMFVLFIYLFFLVGFEETLFSGSGCLKSNYAPHALVRLVFLEFYKQWLL